MEERTERDDIEAKKRLLRVDRIARDELLAETIVKVVATYADIPAVLDGDVTPPLPTLLRRDDGTGLAYAGKDCVLFGPPESGKSLIAQHGAAQVLRDGGSVAWCDLDHAGAKDTVSLLLMFGAPVAALRSPQRFRLAVIDTAEEALAVTADLVAWAPTMAVIDSMGELVPMFPDASSNSADDFRRVHRQVVKPLTGAGVGTIVIDHPPKGAEAGAYGSAGTYAKRAVVDGTMLRVSVFEPFAPGRGGASRITVLKDRNGGLKESCPKGSEPVAALFRVQRDGGAQLWAPKNSDQPSPNGDRDAEDLEKVRALPVEKRSIRAVKALLRCGEPRATRLIAEAG